MKTYQEEILDLIKPLFDHWGYIIEAASKESLMLFEKTATEQAVPVKAISELKRFYEVTDGIPCLEVHVYKPDNPLIFEFWELRKQLWIGQKDMDMISWKDGKFHIGSAGNLNYGKNYVFDNLLELLNKGFKDWYIEGN